MIGGNLYRIFFNIGYISVGYGMGDSYDRDVLFVEFGGSFVGGGGERSGVRVYVNDIFVLFLVSFVVFNDF